MGFPGTNPEGSIRPHAELFEDDDNDEDEVAERGKLVMTGRKEPLSKSGYE
ncbi:hypothetical protein [Mycobacteroides abscessus]|uniref:hypothetical protein n=1 Tax=Mycobacteroides abscessus TaxID=36809 RepID=UPI0013FD064E|nr:hypothetical protein [Mycobacteroides abscessus]